MVVRVTLTDGLTFLSGVAAPASYGCIVFCRVPADWTEEDTLEAVFERLYGKTWREGNGDGSQYVVQNAETHVLTPGEEHSTPWRCVNDTEEYRYRFYHVTDVGELQKVEPSAF